MNDGNWSDQSDSKNDEGLIKSASCTEIRPNL